MHVRNKSTLSCGGDRNSAPRARVAAAGRYNPDIGGTSRLDCLPSPRGTYTATEGATDIVPCMAGARVGMTQEVCLASGNVRGASLLFRPFFFFGSNWVLLSALHSTTLPSQIFHLRAVPGYHQPRKAKLHASRVQPASINQMNARQHAFHAQQAAIPSSVHRSVASVPRATIAQPPTRLQPSARRAMRFQVSVADQTP